MYDTRQSLSCYMISKLLCLYKGMKFSKTIEIGKSQDRRCDIRTQTASHLLRRKGGKGGGDNHIPFKNQKENQFVGLCFAPFFEKVLGNHKTQQQQYQKI
uniref:Uncharacterized protein n=1 Tax=Opuntia streptacantha TaxID=393608 RepID=A0A7C9F1P1_OPUST